MKLAEKLTQIAENEKRVFEAGAKSEYDLFWDSLQDYGMPKSYENRFWAFPNEVFNPKYDFVVSGASSYGAHGTFRQSKIVDLKKNFDARQMYMAGEGLLYTFMECGYLVNARTIKVAKDLKYRSTFSGCSSLEEVRFEGEIGQNGLSFSASPKLSHESLMSVIHHLYDYSADGVGYTVTLGSANLAKLSDAEKAIATQKGWTLA